jgi:hypothetical protein
MDDIVEDPEFVEMGMKTGNVVLRIVSLGFFEVSNVLFQDFL